MAPFEALVLLVTVTLTFFTRKGQNSPWKISTHSPRIMHKARKIEFDVASPLGTPYKVFVQLKQIYGAGCLESCYLSLSETCRNESPTLSLNFEETSPCTFAFFLKTCKNQGLPRNPVKYLMTISISFKDDSPITIHEWEVSPTKNHKYETTKKAKKANSSNVVPINYSFQLPAETADAAGQNPEIDAMEQHLIDKLLFGTDNPPYDELMDNNILLEDFGWFDVNTPQDLPMF